MFCCSTSFNGDISNWNVIHVTNMSYMFDHAPSFNGDISNWNISNVRDMSFMFKGATSFNRKNIKKWDLTKVEKRDMFDDNNCVIM